MSLNETFEPDAASASRVRRFVTESLAAAHVDSHDVYVVVNELATNAILHGRTQFSVHVSVTEGWCRVEIADHNPRMPVRFAAIGEATSGHGLGLVDALCATWGVEPKADGKVIWCEIPLGEGPPQRSRRQDSERATSQSGGPRVR